VDKGDKAPEKAEEIITDEMKIMHSHLTKILKENNIIIYVDLNEEQ
jgi:hypothetical protein